MQKTLFSRLDSKYYLLSIIAGFSYLISLKFHADVPTVLLFSHDVYYASLPLIVFFMCLRLQINLSMKNMLVVRFGYGNFIKFQYLSTFIMIAIFAIVQYCVAFGLGHIGHAHIAGDNVTIAMIALVLNLMLYLACWIIVNLMNIGWNAYLCGGICILLGLCVHQMYFINIITYGYHSR